MFFNDFGRKEDPFGTPKDMYELVSTQPRSKSYQMRSTPFASITDDLYRLIKMQKNDHALVSMKAKISMNYQLNGCVDLITLADTAELALEQGMDRAAIEISMHALKEIIPLHAARFRFYCIMMRANFNLDQGEEAEMYYEQSMACINWHLGGSHPLHITLNGIFASQLIPKYDWKAAQKNYQTALNCSIKCLGPNHVQTAQLHMDYGLFYLR